PFGLNIEANYQTRVHIHHCEKTACDRVCKPDLQLVFAPYNCSQSFGCFMKSRAFSPRPPALLPRSLALALALGSPSLLAQKAPETIETLNVYGTKASDQQLVKQLAINTREDFIAGA